MGPYVKKVISWTQTGQNFARRMQTKQTQLSTKQRETQAIVPDAPEERPLASRFVYTGFQKHRPHAKKPKLSRMKTRQPSTDNTHALRCTQRW